MGQKSRRTFYAVQSAFSAVDVCKHIAGKCEKALCTGTPTERTKVFESSFCFLGSFWLFLCCTVIAKCRFCCLQLLSPQEGDNRMLSGHDKKT